MASYITSQLPDRFGSSQADYREFERILVAQTAQRFQSAVQRGEDLEQLFFATLEDLGKRRHELAHSQGTFRSSEFGMRRDDENAFVDGHLFTYTSLNGPPYLEYQSQVLQIIQEKLRFMHPDPNDGFRDRIRRFEEEITLGKRVCLDVEIFSIETFRQWLFPFTEEGAGIISTLTDYPSFIPGEDLNKWFYDFFQNMSAMEQLKKASIDVYKKAKLFLWFLENNKSSSSLITDHVLLTYRLEVKGKMGALSHYLTWVNRDGTQDPVAKMTQASKVFLIHQDLFLVKTMLNEAARIFKTVLSCESKEAKTLKERVVLWTSVFDNAMPFKRGSAAVSEWFQQAMYRMHGYQLTYRPGKMVNLEVLTKPFSQVVAAYDSMIELTELARPAELGAEGGEVVPSVQAD